ncbi:unnamed protein product [Calypogeia fissa]
MSSSNNASRRLEGKVAVVTGGASGIGEATVRTFVSNGAKVVVADIQDGPGLQLVQELGGDEVARYVHCDVTNETQFAAALDLSVEVFGGLDILHNNAGILGVIGPIEKIEGEDWDSTVQVLVKSYFLGIKHATRIMRAGERGGSIINTASVASLLGGFAPHCYTTCKHALVGLTKSAAAELRSYEIRVNAISPGAVITPLFFKSANSLSGYTPTTSALATAEKVKKATVTDDKKNGDSPVDLVSKDEAPTGLRSTVTTAQDVANVALFLASDESKYVSGHNLVVDGSYTAAPERMQLPLFFGNTGMVTASVKSDDTAFH